tara:strand:+ start:4023 stop:4610 length:588 start_codon:yes stop_codon:yes gene_type:complete
MTTPKWMYEKRDHIHFFSFQRKVFTKKECEHIVKLGKKEGLGKAFVGNKNKLNNKQRKGKISWIHPIKSNTWMFERITYYLNELNKKYFKFELDGFLEGFQFTNYKNKEFYDWHIDRGFNSTYARKLSLTIQLTDPTEYRGADLVLSESTEETVINEKEQGTLIVFPSFTMHKITPIIKGERNSLVGWCSGSNFK